MAKKQKTDIEKLTFEQSINQLKTIVQKIEQGEIPLDDNSLDALLMGELIEHIQDGETVMVKMAKKMKPGGFCYFSTAANSPAEDHILLFCNIGEIRKFIDGCGWKIEKEHLGTLRNMTVKEAEDGGHNINYAAVLTTK